MEVVGYFVDKPLATTVEGCLDVIEASRKAGTLLYMGFNLRHNPVIRGLKRLLEEKSVGDIFGGTWTTRQQWWQVKVSISASVCLTP